MPNANDLREALGLNDLGGAIRPKEVTGAGALQRDLRQAFDEGRGSNALSPSDRGTTGQASQVDHAQAKPAYSVPWSVSPVEMPSRGEEVRSPVRAQVALPTYETPRIRSSPPAGLAGSTGLVTEASPITIDDLMPRYDTSDETNEEYEDYFSGMSEGNAERPDKFDWNGLADVATVMNPLGGVALRNVLNSPTANQLARDSGLSDALGRAYDWFNSDKVDDARTPESASSPWATGEAMQRYGEMGMGGRDWWEYDPNAVYNKADEQQDFGFVPYLPDNGSRLGMTMSQLLDAFGDVAGFVSQGRRLLTNDLPEWLMGVNGGYGTTIDLGGRKIDNENFEYAATPYINNMRRILENNPEQVLRRPKDGRLHGAPVDIEVMEYAIPNADGGTSYLYGEYAGMDPDLNDDGSLRMHFTDGQSVDVPRSVWGKWEAVDPDGNPELDIPFDEMSSYVRMGDARGLLPSDLDSLNDRAIRERDWEHAPVLYMPYLTLDDGTKLTWNEAQRVYMDRDNGENRDISYDFGPLGLARPQRLNRQLLDEEGWHPETFVNNAIDYTLGSLPIMVNKVAWPTSVAQAVGKGAMGIDAGRYDPVTGSDQYIAADLDEDGHIEPTYTPLQHMTNVVGTALTPAFEEMAGPLSGHSWAERNLIRDQVSPSLRRLWGNFALDTLGEGVEELVGNVVDEVSGQADAAYGNPTTPTGERLLDDSGRPVTDESGRYRYVNAYGEPMTSMVDETGREYKDPNTPLYDRIRNAIDPVDALNTVVGGMQVAGLLGGPGTLMRTPAAIRGDLMERRLGMRPYVPTEWDRYMLDPENSPAPEIVEMDPRFQRLFSDELPEEAM